MFSSKKCVSLLIAVTAIGAVAASGPQRPRHPDGSCDTYRGWGPTSLSMTGYTCTLFNSDGAAAGEIYFGFSDGAIDVVLGGRDAHFSSTGAGGVFGFAPLDEAAFPDLADVPAEFKTDDHSLLSFSGRSVIGENVDIADPETALARSISVVEARCVYIIDSNGIPVYCLNCLFGVTVN